MQKSFSPLLGYNNNVRHKSRVFHIQTEDSGIKRPHIITHLFMDGGRILKSLKTSYADHVASENRADIVREMMKQQHKAMFNALREGQFDHMIEESGALPSSGARDATRPTVPSSPEPSPHAANGTQAPTVDAKRRPEERVATELVVDIAALERAAAALQTSSPLFAAAADMPPPPQRLFRDHLGRPAPSARAGTGPCPSPIQPASIFSPAKDSLFGEELLSERTLDEVILSYLADDAGE